MELRIPTEGNNAKLRAIRGCYRWAHRSVRGLGIGSLSAVRRHGALSRSSKTQASGSDSTSQFKISIPLIAYCSLPRGARDPDSQLVEAGGQMRAEEVSAPNVSAALG